MNTIDSMFWMDGKIPEEYRRELRISSIVHTGMLIRDAWEVRDGKFGVPRAWAKGHSLVGYDATVRPKLDWPAARLQWRYNQKEVVDCATKSLRDNYGCLIAAPPGFGKTVVSLAVASKFHTPTLVLVNKEDLVGQWRETASAFFGLEAGHVQEDRLDYEREVTIAMIQTLNSRMDRLPEDFWRYFGMVICDEGHRMPCDSFVQVIKKLPARYRLGCSATWRRKDGMEPFWKWHISDQICEGEKNDVRFLYQPINIQTSLTDKDFFQRGEINHVKCITKIAEDEGYNQWLVKTILEGMEKRNILLVSHRISQLERIDALLRLQNVNPGIYVGKWRGKKLQADQLEDAKNRNPVLATYKKIEEGSDIPRLDTVILATPCTDPEQTCGRVGRAFPGKEFALVIDPVINGYYCNALFKKRESHYARLGFSKI